MSSVNKVTHLLVMLAASLFLSSMAHAQAAKPLKIGFVNVQRLLIESPQANAANRALESLRPVSGTCRPSRRPSRIAPTSFRRMVP
jgi:hypothetical protein